MEQNLFEKWMTFAFTEAKAALASNEVPIGAVFVLHPVAGDRVNFAEGRILSKGHNMTNINKNVFDNNYLLSSLCRQHSMLSLLRFIHFFPLQWRYLNKTGQAYSFMSLASPVLCILYPIHTDCF